MTHLYTAAFDQLSTASIGYARRSACVARKINLDNMVSLNTT